jgi:hypothetical protein
MNRREALVGMGAMVAAASDYFDFIRQQAGVTSVVGAVATAGGRTIATFIVTAAKEVLHRWVDATRPGTIAREKFLPTRMRFEGVTLGQITNDWHVGFDGDIWICRQFDGPAVTEFAGGGSREEWSGIFGPNDPIPVVRKRAA